MSEKKLVLIIDDDPDVLDSMKVALESNGFDTSTAMNGEEGLELASRIKPDFVFCDIMMERIDTGIDTAMKIREMYKNVPIYLLSDIGQITSLNIDIYGCGLNGCVQKPITSKEITSIVRHSVRS